jgi:hypothetical protein
MLNKVINDQYNFPICTLFFGMFINTLLHINIRAPEFIELQALE